MHSKIFGFRKTLMLFLSVTVNVKPFRYSTEGFPEKFPYRTKAVFCFEVIDGAEVCFFAFHVQEYGSKCPKPNTR